MPEQQSRQQAHRLRTAGEPAFGDARWRQWQATQMLRAIAEDIQHPEQLARLEHHIVCLLIAVRSWRSQPAVMEWRDLSDEDGSGDW